MISRLTTGYICLGSVFYILVSVLFGCPAPFIEYFSQPATPEALTLSSGNNQISVNWLAGDWSLSYDVFFNTIDDPATAEQFAGNITSNSAVITGLTNGITYYVWVRARAINWPVTSAFTPTSCCVPGFYFTSGPTLTIGDGEIEVSWSSLYGATSYEVWYNTSMTTARRFGGGITDNTATLTGLNNGVVYYVWIKAKDANGTSTLSPLSNARPFGPQPLVLNTWMPGSIIIGQEQWYSFNVVSGNTYSIYWDCGSSDGSGTYNCSVAVSAYRSDQVTSYFIEALSGYATPQTITAAASELVYIKVQGWSYSSGTFAVKASIPGPGTPFLVAGNGQLGVNWAAFSGATAYEVWYNTVNNPNPAVQFGGDIAGTSTIVTGLTNGTRYYVWVRAKVSGGYTDFSQSANGCPFVAQTINFNTWTHGIINADGEQWYSFNAVSGRTYSIYWDDSYSGSGTYTCVVKVSAYRADCIAAYFTAEYSGYFSPRTFTAVASELVYIKLQGYNSSNSGTFAIKVSIPGPNAPILAPGDGQLGVSWTALSGATAYEVWYNTTNITSSAVQFGGDIAGTSTTITGLTNGTRYYVWVRAKISGGYTDFSSSSDACPFIAQAIGFNTWIPGSITANAEQWYCFNAVAGNKYYIYWDDSYGSGLYNCFISVSAYRENVVTSYFSSANYGYTTPQTITAAASELVYIKVQGYYSSYSGTFAVKVSIPGPGAPVLAPGNGQLKASWTALSRATAYEVWYSTTNNITSAVQFGGDIAGISTTITGLTNGTRYYVWVRAKVPEGITDFSSSSSICWQAIGLSTWTPGSIPVNGEQWYCFNAVSGNKYNIYWDDSNNGSGIYTCFVSVSAYREDLVTSYFTSAINGYSTPRTITAAASELVYIRVKANYSSSYWGTFAVKASISGPNAPALAPGNGQIDVAWTAVSGAIAYEVWYNTTNTIVSAIQFGGDISGTSTVITGLTNGTRYYVWVRAKISEGTTDFSSSSNASPFSAQALSFNTWTAGDMTAGGERWFCFTAVSGVIYNIYWDDSFSGSNTYSCDVAVSSYRANTTTAYFTLYDSGYYSPRTITAAASEFVYIKVQGYGSGSSGTFAVRVVQQ